jgi:hypothetical protein
VEFEKTLLNLHLWMLMLGGIAETEKLGRTWYVEGLARYAGKWRNFEWSSVKEILTSYLWLESNCELGGRLLWAEVMAKHMTDDVTVWFRATKEGIAAEDRPTRFSRD